MMSEWISVDDRLPENDEYVLCAMPWAIDGVWKTSGCVIKCLHFCLDDSTWFDEDVDTRDWDVTHWVPLPEPPICGTKLNEVEK